MLATLEQLREELRTLIRRAGEDVTDGPNLPMSDATQAAIDRVVVTVVDAMLRSYDAGKQAEREDARERQAEAARILRGGPTTTVMK